MVMSQVMLIEVCQGLVLRQVALELDQINFERSLDVEMCERMNTDYRKQDFMGMTDFDYLITSCR